jgi:sterol desaturase/sphingolipid hydroxylase (fatty acid hydroxylase superfamily)
VPDSEDSGMRPRSKLIIFAFGLVFVGLGILVFILLPANLKSFIAAKPGQAIGRVYIDLLQTSLLTFPFWIAIVVTLGLQVIAPANPNQKILNRGFAEDFVWFVYEAVLHAIVIVTYVDLLTRLYGRYASRLTISALMQMPGWLRFLAAILLVDFLYWLQHYLHHRIPFLWKLHALHHSQTELNFFTDFRYHVLEYLARHTVLIIPLLILKIDPPVIASVAIVQRWYSRFYHGNIRTNLGALRFLLVTPQSHRIHHSIYPQHANRNFGAIFSIWDYLFGTASHDHQSYPATGIIDNEFPHRTSGRITEMLLAPLRQMAHSLAPRGRDVEQLPVREKAIL